MSCEGTGAAGAVLRFRQSFQRPGQGNEEDVALDTLMQQMVNGITLGGMYALIALGYTLVYGIMLMINFAHSEMFMAGAYVGLGVLKLLSDPAVAKGPLSFLAPAQTFFNSGTLRDYHASGDYDNKVAFIYTVLPNRSA
jgi:branched-subunit amino acid ABC-type transport system permease component